MTPQPSLRSPSDLSGSLSHSELWGHEGAGLRLSGSLRAIAPTSYASRVSNTITNLTASLSLSKAFGKKLSASYGVGFTKFFATTTYRGQTGSQYDSDGIPLCLDSEREGGGCQGGLNSIFAISHSLGVGYSFTDKLSGSLGFGVRQRIDNYHGEDPAVAERVTNDGGFESRTLGRFVGGPLQCN